MRAATGADVGRIGELAEGLLGDMASRRGASLLPAPDWGDPPGLASVVTDPARLAVVATLDGVVTGFALCSLVEGRPGGTRGVLGACYVEPEARGVGLGRMLMDAVIAWLDDRGCSGVEAIAFPGDRQAKNYFESAGFRAELLTMYRHLG